MSTDWRPTDLEKRLRTQVAYDDTHVHFRFRWAQPDPGGWLHDLLVYHEGAWRQFAAPSPWVAEGHPEHTGFYEDRVSFFLDDGSVRGFAEFGGWLTTHEGMRSLPSEAPTEAVRDHPHFGERLGKTDIRKYLPQACAGEWWEGDWRSVRPPEELAALKADGVFLDLPMWRAHRSDPLGYGTDAHVLDYRHPDAGRKTYRSQAWDPETGPEYMFDPAVVDGGALDYGAITAGDVPEQGVDTYALTPEVTVPFDSDVAEWEGAMIPRRPLQEPRGSAADWTANGTWADGEWSVEMSRRLRTDHPDDTKQLTPGEVYTWAPAVHHGAGKRWHWVGYPYRLGLGIDPGPAEGHPDPLVAREVATLDWDAVETYTIPLVFPGVLSWTHLIDDGYAASEAIRNLETTIWAIQGGTGGALPRR